MTSFQSESFNFFTFDPTNVSHLRFLKEMEQDSEVQRYLHSIEDFLLEGDSGYLLSNAYLVGVNDTIVGYLNLIDDGLSEQMHYAVLPRYRGIRINSENTIGCEILKESSETLFKMYDTIRYLELYIDHSNIRSIKTATKAGFKLAKRYLDGDEYHKYPSKGRL